MSSRSSSPMTRTRLAKITRTTANGTKVVTTKLVEAPVLEWKLQAAGVRRLRQMPGFLSEMPAHGVLPADAFTLAGDFAAARRSPQEATKAKATGLTPGEHDIRLYLAGARLGLIEMKGAKTRLAPEQKDRHALLAALGFTLQAVVRASSEDEAATKVVGVVSGWLAANDNQPAKAE